MAPQAIQKKRSSGHHTQKQRAYVRNELSRFDDLLKGDVLPAGLRMRMRALLEFSVNEKVRLRIELARATECLEERDGDPEDVDESSKIGEKSMRRENAKLQSKIAAVKKDLVKREDELRELRAPTERRCRPRSQDAEVRTPNQQETKLADLPDCWEETGDVAKDIVGLRKEAAELLKEVAFLRGVVDDRGEGGLLALFERGKKLFESQTEHVDGLTARVGDAVLAAETARQEKDEAVSTVQAKLAATNRERDETVFATEKLKAELKEKDATIATMKAMSRPAPGVTAPHIPDVEQTLLFVRNLQRDVQERDRIIAKLQTSEARLQASEAKLQAKQTEMLTLSAASKTTRLELQDKYDALRQRHGDLATLVSDSQELNNALNQEHDKLVKELGRRF